MLRVEMHDAANAKVMRLEGRFIGDYAEYTRTLVTRSETDMRLVVDLTEVTAVDSVGEEVLSFFGRLGAEFIADDVYGRYLCERLRLPLVRAGLRTRRRGVAHSIERSSRHPSGDAVGGDGAKNVASSEEEHVVEQ